MNKKLKIWYAIFACFVFIVMTIGSTYAYWAVSVSSDSNAVNTSSAIYGISMVISPVPEYTGFSFIPMNDEDALKAIKNKCKDKYDRGACSAYTIRVFGYDENLDAISGYIDFDTTNISNLSYMVLEEKDTYVEDSCVVINDKNYCVAKDATSMGDGEKLSLGDSYNVLGLEEKNLLLVIWLTNLNTSQNESDIGNFNAEVTMLAGIGGEIKGTISSAIRIDQNNNQNP